MEAVFSSLWIAAVAFGIPTAITGFALARLNKTILKKEQQRDIKDQNREQFQIKMMKCICASILLGEATALAVKNGRTNGEMDTALRYAKQVKDEQLNFLQEEGIKKIL